MAQVTYSTSLAPQQVRLEFSAHCPASCAPCHRQFMAREPGHMPMTLLSKCVEDIRQFPQRLEEIVPTAWGEFQMNPRWEEMLHHIAHRLPWTRLVVPTNGILLNDSTVEKLAAVSTLHLVNLSVDAFFPATYEAFKKLPARHLESVQETALKLRKLRPDVRIWASMVYSSEFQSPKEKELFEEHWNRLLGPGTAQVVMAQYTSRARKPHLIPVSRPCRSIYSDIAVHWDGAVVSGCCFDSQGELIVGNAYRMNLSDCWHSQEYSELRAKHSQGKRGELELCRDCTFA